MKKFFKWIGIIIWILLIYVFLQVPQVETTPTYSFEGYRAFNEAMKHLNFFHNISMIIVFTIITLIMEWYLCKWVGNKLDFSQKLTTTNLCLGVIAGIIAWGISKIIMLSKPKSTGINIYSATLQTKLGIPLFIAIVVIAPILEELLFQAAIQKGIFRRLKPWIAIILTELIFAFAHTPTFGLDFWNIFLGGLPLAYVYQKTDDIKIPIISHAVNNLIPFIIAYAPFILESIQTWF